MKLKIILEIIDINRRHKTVIALGFCLAIAVTCLIYWPGLHGPFVFDDLSNILLVPQLQIAQLDLASLHDAAFWQKDSSLGRPIAMLSFALNYYFTQFDTFYFKFTNLVIHLCNGALLYWLGLRILSKLPSPSGQSALTPYHLRWFSLAIVALWLVHPLNLTSVLYVVQRMTSLSAFFTLLGLAGYVIGRELILKNRILGFVVIFTSLSFFGLLATLSKENGVLLPLYMLVLELWVFRFHAPGRLSNVLKWYWAVIITAPIIIAVGILVAKPHALLGIFNYQFRNFTLEQRLLTETRALWFYLRLILVPDIRQMGIYHDDIMPSSDLLHPPPTTLAIIGILGLVVIVTAGFRRTRILSFAIAWFLVGHSLESTFLPLELVHEHRNYLPQYGILFALVYYLVYPHPKLRKSLGLRQGLLSFYLVLLCGVTYARATDWKDEWTLYNRDVINHPESGRAHTILAVILHDNKQFQAAEFHLRKAAQLEPANAEAIIRLAQNLYGAHRSLPEDVLVELERRLRAYPYSGLTIGTLEPLLSDTLEDPTLNLRLVRMFEQLIARKDIVLSSGWYEFAYRTLAFTYRERKDYKTALAYFDKAMELEPHPAYYLSKGEIYMKLGRPEEATRMLDQVVALGASLNEDNQKRRNNLIAAINLAAQKHKTQRTTH